MNVTEVVFSGFYKTQICGLYQYDYGQVLKFTDITLPATYEVHFAQSGASTTVTVLGDSNGVQIPDQYLLADLDIRAYIYLHEEETDGETVYQVLIPVIARPEPTDVEPTPVEQDIITQAIAALNIAVEKSSQSASDSAESAEASAQSAQSASDSATASAQSAQSALDSANRASTSEASASASAQSAQQSATSASASAQSAKGYTEQAEASATNAETSETNARTSAQTASAKASEASASASNAQTSAFNAQASATSAGTSASSASASAQTASTKASEASDSATSASESASTAVSAKDDAVTAKEEAETAKADAEKASEEAQESAQTVANKADKDGTYPDMTVGGVMSSDGSTDSTPYLYRVSGGGVEVGSVEEDSIVGGTIAWNQLVPTRDGEQQKNLYGGMFGTSAFKHDVTVGHVYFWGFTQPAGCGVYQQGRKNFGSYAGFPAPENNTRREFITKSIANTNTNVVGVGMISKLETTEEYYHLSDLIFVDLTQMFGSSVADYIYSLEQSSTGAGVTFFRKLFPKDYYEYNSGELMSVEGVSAHVMRDADDNIIGNYPLDSSLTLRGIPKLSNGLYFDGDTYEADGTVTRKYGVVNLGTLTWEAWTGYAGVYRTPLPSECKTIPNNTLPNWVAPIYKTVIGTDISSNNKTIGQLHQTYLVVHDDSYSTASDFKTAMNGMYLVYELATPTTESAEPYDSIQKVSKYGTEEYVSTGIVPVGHVTKYPTDIVAKVNGLPSDFSTLIAPTETGFKATRAYSVNQFLIVNNQLYRVTSAIANGATITVGTNVTATTVADILTSLLNA